MAKKKKKIGCLAALAAAVLLLGGAALWAWSIANSKYQGEAIRLYFPDGTSAEAAADTLSANLGAFGDKVVDLLKTQNAGSVKGSYVVTTGQTAMELSRVLKQGRQTPVRVTFNNARLLGDMAERVCRNLEITPAEFMAACDTLLPAAGYKPAEFPAAFLPDTYEFYWNASAETVVNRLTRARDKFWNDERLHKARALRLTPAQIATLASIVEEETAKSDERPKVARLYLNRLDRGMLLQADPTVKYAVGDFALRRILGNHLRVESPYNTYLHPGLPPGPIRLVEASTIDAVLNAPQHDYLYMCAKEDFSGYHNFARDYATHMQNARRYQAELNRRGIN